MRKVFYIIMLGHSRVTAVALVDKSRTNVTKLTGNAAFPTPSPSLVEMTAAADTLDAATQAYDFTRSRVDKQVRDRAFVGLKDLRSLLGSYVQNESKGDQALITSAGFQTQRSSEPLGLLPAPGNVRASALPFPGQVEVLFAGVKGRIAYLLEVCGGDPKVEADWKYYGTTGKNRMVVSGLQSDRVHFFRVITVGAAGNSAVSTFANAKAA